MWPRQAWAVLHMRDSLVTTKTTRVTIDRQDLICEVSRLSGMLTKQAEMRGEGPGTRLGTWW